MNCGIPQPVPESWRTGWCLGKENTVRHPPRLPGRRGQLLGEDAHSTPGGKTLPQHPWKMGCATVTELGLWPDATTDIRPGATPTGWGTSG